MKHWFIPQLRRGYFSQENISKGDRLYCIVCGQHILSSLHLTIKGEQMNVSVYELQVRIEKMYADRGFEKASPQTLALGICEEAGEVAQAILLTETLDFKPSEKKLTEEWKDTRNVASEIGDLITYAIALCNKLGIEPEFKWMKKGY